MDPKEGRLNSARYSRQQATLSSVGQVVPALCLNFIDRTVVSVLGHYGPK